MKRNFSHTRAATQRDQFDALMEAVALLLARRQMKKHWGV